MITSRVRQQKIIQQCHTVNGVDGHFGVKKTLSAVQARFYWKGVADDVASFVKVCDPCQRENPQLNKAPATLHPIPVTASFWHQVGVDLVGPLPATVSGYKYILTCCCYFTKWAEAIPIKDKTAYTVASALYKLQCEKGAAAVFIHDQGTEFINQVNDELCRLMDISKRIATAYHPMTNGLDERWNGTLQTALRKVIDQDAQDDWDEHLDPIMSAYRATRHESTGFSPYFMVFHKEPRLPVDVDFGDDQQCLEETSQPILHDGDIFNHYMKSMCKVKERIKELASENILKSQARQKKNFDKRHKIPSFRVGSHILLKNMTRQARQGGKMESHFTGPYEIIEEIGKGVYRLKNLKTQKVLGKTYNSMRFKEYHCPVSDQCQKSENCENSERASKKRKYETEHTPAVDSGSTTDVWIQSLNLKPSDRITILHDELNDRCIDAVSNLLKRQFPNMKGLQSTLVLHNTEHCEHVGLDCDSVQVIHQSSRNHWIACAVKQQEVYIYDSMQPSNGQLPIDTKSILKNLYGDLQEFITSDVTQQTGTLDCGLFAVAFVTAVCHGVDPADFRLSQGEMRGHLLSCLESGHVSVFPATKKRQRKPIIRWDMNKQK